MYVKITFMGGDLVGQALPLLKVNRCIVEHRPTWFPLGDQHLK
jgi:hypothetical protein